MFSCYRPVDNDRPIPPNQLRLHQADWRRLLYLAHVNKRQAFTEFTDFYLRSTGQLYWNDTHQINIYLDDYHRPLDAHLGAQVPGTEMITEVYVPRAQLTEFMAAVREDFLRHAVDFIYGTIRLINKDEDAFLAWARRDYVCVIFNLHVDHHASRHGPHPARLSETHRPRDRIRWQLFSDVPSFCAPRPTAALLSPDAGVSAPETARRS